jgi:hypothetical protein
MLRRAEPRSRTSWCQSFRAKREIRSFRHIADQRVAPFCGGAPCACTIRPYQPEGFVDRPITIPPGAKLALPAEAGAPEGMEDSYAFVMNVARPWGAGFALGAGYELRRANTEESAVIKETLQRGHGTAKNDAVGVAGTPLAVLSNLWRRRSGDITLSASEGPTKVCCRLRRHSISPNWIWR